MRICAFKRTPLFIPLYDQFFLRSIPPMLHSISHSLQSAFHPLFHHSIIPCFGHLAEPSSHHSLQPFVPHNIRYLFLFLFFPSSFQHSFHCLFIFLSSISLISFLLYRILCVFHLSYRAFHLFHSISS